MSAVLRAVLTVATLALLPADAAATGTDPATTDAAASATATDKATTTETTAADPDATATPIDRDRIVARARAAGEPKVAAAYAAFRKKHTTKTWRPPERKTPWLESDPVVTPSADGGYRVWWYQDPPAGWSFELDAHVPAADAKGGSAGSSAGSSKVTIRHAAAGFASQ